MKARILRMSAALALITLIVPVAGAQSKKQVYFEINTPYRMRMANYLLPSAKYILYQVSQNDLNLFFLYKDDMRHTPIAAIRTVRIYHASGVYPDRTEMRWTVDERTGDGNVPLVTGWEIPGDDGWE